MKRFVVVLAAVMAVGCTSIDYKPYPSDSITYQGKGGQGMSYDGVDFWDAGASPSRKFRVIGAISSPKENSAYRNSIIDAVKKSGGQGVIKAAKTPEQIAKGDTAPTYIVIQYVQ